MYGLKQAGILANQLLQQRLAPYRYYPDHHKPGLWLHKTRPITFTLVVDMSEKEARERAGRLREANRASADGSACIPPIGNKDSGTLKVILHVSRKASPSAWGDVKPDLKLPAKSIGDTLAGTSVRRDGLATVGDLVVELKLEGLDATKMDDLGGVTDEIVAA
jgi:hypothetical protein